MTEALVNSGRAAEPESELDSALFHRRIEFHQARKPFGGFGNNTSNGFKLVTLNPTSEPQVTSSLGKKIEKSTDFCENGLDPELCFEVSFRRIGAGLRNLGNTCFLNSVLQCLTYTEPLAAYLQSGKHQNSCHTAGFCALCAIQKHVSRALQSTGRTLEPKDLVYNLRRISRNFRNCRQEDAHEYMVYLLESMHKCCLPTGVPSESPSAYDRSLVHKIFGGRLRSQVKCMQCSYCSNKFDPFLDLSLEILKANSLEMALSHFTTKELLDGGAKEYQCQQCKQKVKALKQLTISKAPHVLTVHLKRFSSHAPGQKIVKKIDFKPTLDLKPFVTGPYEGDLNYTLYGVLVHVGCSTRSGHYYCYVRTSTGMWYALDDNEVSHVNERKVLAQEAYMLFYVRDRKHFSAKKPFDTTQKGNFIMNGMGNPANSKINFESRGKIQNGSNENKLNGSLSVALSEKGAVAATHLETSSENISSPDTNGIMAVEKDIFPKKLCVKKSADSIQNGSNEKKSLALSVGGAVVSTQPEKAPSANTSFPNTNGTLAVDNSGLKSDPKSEDSLVVHLTEDPVKRDPMSFNSVGRKRDSCTTVDGSGVSFNPGQAAKNVTCNSFLSVVDKQNTSALISGNGEALLDSLHRKDSSYCIPRPSNCKENSQGISCRMTKKGPTSSLLGTLSQDSSKLDSANSEMCSSKDTPMGAIAEPSNKANDITHVQQNSIEESQVGGSCVKTAVPTIEKTCENGKKLDIIRSKLSSGLPATTKPITHEISKKKRANLKVRRKLYKCRVGTTSISSNIIFGAGLCIRKKRHNRRKHNSRQKKLSNMIPLSDGSDSPSKLGQSVTEESFPLLVDLRTHSQKKKAQCGADDQNQTLTIHNMNGVDIISGYAINNEFTERVVLNGNSAEKQSQTRDCTQVTGTSEEYQRGLRQTDVMSILTRGLDETIVARWDGNDVSLSNKSETRTAEAAPIGYVGDEWDEEYDRGKRKKIRNSKMSFDGPNLFQEIATKNAKRKRPKLERSRFEEQPFRI